MGTQESFPRLLGLLRVLSGSIYIFGIFALRPHHPERTILSALLHPFKEGCYLRIHRGSALLKNLFSTCRVRFCPRHSRFWPAEEEPRCHQVSGVVMPFGQKNPQCSPDQWLQTHSAIQAMEGAQDSEALEEACLPSHPPRRLPMLASPGLPQIFRISSPPPLPPVTSSNKSGEASRDPKNMPVDAPEENASSLENFLLLTYQTREPITKADMLKTVNKECGTASLRVPACTEVTFGLDRKGVDDTRHCYAVIRMELTCDETLVVQGVCPRPASRY